MHSEAPFGEKALRRELGAVAADDIERLASLTAWFCLVALSRLSIYPS